MSIELKKLNEVDLINPNSIDPFARLYLYQNGKSYSIYWRNIQNILSNNFNSGLNSDEGDGFIFENGAVNSRRLNYSDLLGVPSPSPFNKNISVTFLQNSNIITINPLGIVQEYMIGANVYSISETFVFNVDDLINPLNQRQDLIVLKKEGVIEYRKGEEASIAVSPIINGDEFIYLQILKTAGGESVGNPVSDVSVANGLEIESGNIVFGGLLQKNTTLDTASYNLNLGSVTINSNNLELNGLLIDNDDNLPTLEGHVLSFDLANSKLVWRTIDANTNLLISNITATTLDIESSTGTNVTLPESTSSTAGLMNASDKTKSDFISITQAVDLDEIETQQGELVTLSGVPSNSTDLGTFTGAIITDNSTNKTALQSLETSLENVFTAINFDANLESSYIFDNGFQGNTTFFRVIHADLINIFSSISYSFKEFGGTWSAETTDLTTFNSSLSGIGAAVTFSVRITVSFQPGINTGSIHYNIKTT